MHTHTELASMDRSELNRAAAHARNARDAYAPGSLPTDIATNLQRVLAELERRKSPRLQARAALTGKS
jgi:hypothetical protein